MKKIEIFDMNGPEQFTSNPMLVFDALRLERTLSFFETENIKTGLYGLSSHPKEYMQNEVVQDALENDLQRFPLIFVDDQLVLEKKYPTVEQFATWSGLNEDIIPKDPPVSEVAAFLSMISGVGGCGGSCGGCSGCDSYSSEEHDFEEVDF